MFELHQFRHSAFCLKVRMALKAKTLPFSVVELKPGLDQVSIFRLSGQQKVPVLLNGEVVIHDSSEIIRYLDSYQSGKRLVPNDPKKSTQAYLIEDWADTTFANAARISLFRTSANDSELRKELLNSYFPKPIVKSLGGVPWGAIKGFSEVFMKEDEETLFNSLKQLSQLVQSSEWLVGKSMSVADLAVAAQLSLIKFPASSGPSIAGKGVKGLCDNPQFEPLFIWRDNLELALEDLAFK